MRLNDKSATGGPEDSKRDRGHLQSCQWWHDVCPAQMGCSLPCSPGNAPLFSAYPGSKEHTEDFSVPRTGWAFERHYELNPCNKPAGRILSRVIR